MFLEKKGDFRFKMCILLTFKKFGKKIFLLNRCLFQIFIHLYKTVICAERISIEVTGNLYIWQFIQNSKIRFIDIPLECSLLVILIILFFVM